jgi:alpha-tubulin suppressor-like RCC1 family protein
MKGVMAFVAAAVLATGVSAFAQDAAGAAKDAQAAAKNTKAAAGKMAAMTAKGTVKSVAADSIVVTDKDGKDWTFAVDKTTKVYAKGGSHMTAEKKASGETMTIADAVKVGEKVTVKYHDMGETKHAAEVRVI